MADKLLSIKQVEEKISFSRSAIYVWIKSGYFPASTLFGEGKRKIARWSELEIDRWIQDHYSENKAS